MSELKSGSLRPVVPAPCGGNAGTQIAQIHLPAPVDEARRIRASLAAGHLLDGG